MVFQKFEKSSEAKEKTLAHESEPVEYHNADDDNHNSGEIEKVYPPAPKLILILIACALSVFLVALDNTIISTAIPRIADEFHSLDDIGWYGSAFFITTAAFQSIWGKAYKYFSVRLNYLLSILLFEAGSTLCAAAPSSTAPIVGRAVAGVGGAGISTGSYLIIALVAPPRKMAALQGVISASFAVASIAGPLIGGMFTQSVTWRWSFWINLPIGAVACAFVIIFFTTPEHGKPAEAPWKEKVIQMDIPGTAPLMGAVICVLLALQWGGIEKSWASAPVIGTLVGAGVLAVVYTTIEWFAGERAALNMRLLRHKPIAFLMIHQVCVCSSFFIMLYYLPIYFQAISGANPATSGVRIIPLIACGSVFAIVSGLIISFTGEYQMVMVTGNALLALGSGLIYTLGLYSPTRDWVGYQLIVGVGLGLSVQVAIIVCQSLVTSADLSTVSAMALFFQLLAGAVFLSVGESVFGNELIRALSDSFGTDRAHELFTAGPTALRALVTPAELHLTSQAYVDGLRAAYLVSILLSSLATVVAVIGFFTDRRKFAT